MLSTTAVFNSTGTQELETYGPLHWITLAADLTSGSTSLAAAGSQLMTREYTVKTYDTGVPPTAPRRPRTRSRWRPSARSRGPGRT
ncbi:hypothetical protein [Streptomyces sp. ALI-76-A]|uniref:hypothetical protein n=1 Tax=Streptomyces sp. ALI-76-A TaxID=3025736 RepID=UPI00256EBA5B|nr:hypothetical protein [Streptomyces sp. ALI-76-A]MDL5206458.1 hypothetical protein [Streptomyces sp. ALI-76-A]